MNWAAAEFKTIELGGARLNNRSVLLLERLAQKPSASIPRACRNWVETAAAYRFLSNDDVRCVFLVRFIANPTDRANLP
jgi:hypothetical protein